MLKFVAAVLTAFLLLTLTACSPRSRIISWTEDVKLPSGKIIQLQRSEEYETPSYGNAPTFFRRETILIPRDDNKKPVLWQSIWDPKSEAENSLPQKVIAQAIYFEDGQPRIVSTDNGGGADSIYGCVFTNLHRLWIWSDSQGWIYDPRARTHITYKGLPDMYLGVDSITARALAASPGHLAPITYSPLVDSHAVIYINPTHEQPLCQGLDKYGVSPNKEQKQ